MNICTVCVLPCVVRGVLRRRSRSAARGRRGNDRDDDDDVDDDDDADAVIAPSPYRPGGRDSTLLS